NGTHVKVWDAATGRETDLDIPGHSVGVFAVAWDRDGRRIATAGTDFLPHAVRVWDAVDGRMHFEISVGQDSSAGPYQAVAFSPDGLYLVTGKVEGDVQVWDATTGQPVPVRDARAGQKLNTFATHDQLISGLVFSRDGRHLASVSSD